ncbi:MAG: isoprenylcysteine carboxylmethyltransferase family protein [bacterium]|nr:isoprenylcysteine carboxylmethyltransferase family protein [bacterium]
METIKMNAQCTVNAGVNSETANTGLMGVIRKRLVFRPPFLAMASFTLLFLASLFIPGLRILFFPYNLAGIIPVLFGIGIMMWAWFIFQKKETVICPLQNAKKLVLSGPFRFTRNPMYVGMAAILLGGSILWGSILPFFSIAIFFSVINYIVIPHEEKSLLAIFEVEYEDYKKMVRRWL